jgi:hypothetical protein
MHAPVLRRAVGRRGAFLQPHPPRLAGLLPPARLAEPRPPARLALLRPPARWAALLPVLLATAGLWPAAPARAVEERNPFHAVLPPTQPYDPNARLILDPRDGSVLQEMPDRITINFRRFEFGLDPSSLELWIDQQEFTEQLHFWTDQAWLDLQQQPAGAPQLKLGPGQHFILARIRDVAGSYWNSISSIALYPYPCPGGCPWPFAPTTQPNAVSNLMEDWQDFNGTPYFHSGVDIRVPAGTPVHSCTDGTVVKVDNYSGGSSLYWEVAVQDPVGYIWQYHHLEGASIAVSEGALVVQGQVLGNVVTWSTAMNGFTYNHMHLNVVRWFGPGAIPGPYVDGFEHYNPLRFLIKGTPDAVFPQQFNVWFADNESNSPFAADSDAGDPTLDGHVDVIAKLRDRRDVLSPANGQPYELGIYKLAWQAEPIDTPCGVGSVPRTTLATFNSMPGGTVVADQEAILLKIYKQFLNTGGSFTASKYDYTTQQYFYTLTNTHNGVPDDVGGFWETNRTTALGGYYPDGLYALTLYARDYYGNETATTTNVRLNNRLGYSGICADIVLGPAWVNPMDLVTTTGEVAEFLPPFVPVTFGPMHEGSAHAVVGFQGWPVWNFDLPNRQIRVAVGLLQGHVADVEFVPLLGDVIMDIDAEVQVMPLGPAQTGQVAFSPFVPSSNPARLRLSTRLARDPWTGQALVGRPARLGEVTHDMVLTKQINVLNEAMLLRSVGPGGGCIVWRLSTTATPGASPTPVARPTIALSAYPNPFNPRVTVKVDLGSAAIVAVDVLDARGRRVRQLHSGRLPAGASELTWDGRDALGRPQAAGVYFVRVSGENGLDAVQKVAMVK